MAIDWEFTWIKKKLLSKYEVISIDGERLERVDNFTYCKSSKTQMETANLTLLDAFLKPKQK